MNTKPEMLRPSKELCPLVAGFTSFVEGTLGRGNLLFLLASPQSEMKTSTIQISDLHTIAEAVVPFGRWGTVVRHPPCHTKHLSCNTDLQHSEY